MSEQSTTTNQPAVQAPEGAGGAGLRRVLFALPGLHRVVRGAEVALEAVARELARLPGFEVTLIGSGEVRAGEPYRFVHVPCVPRERFERWPRVPVLRDEYCWEEATFAWGLRRAFDADAFDATVTCSYPFCNWLLRRRGRSGRRAAHVYVTQNGDWPAQCKEREYRYFGCDALVCTNPEYFERNKSLWPSVLIPNGVDPGVFSPGPAVRERFGLPADGPVVLMVSALIASKRVEEGLRAAAALPGVFVAVAGDGPLRTKIDGLARDLLPGRFARLSVARADMPALYRCADVVLHASLDEPFGNVFVEALATGLPVVAHDRDVSRWVFEGTGILVDSNNRHAVIAGLERALSHSGEVSARRDLAVRRFSWRSIAAAYASAITAACQNLERAT